MDTTDVIAELSDHLESNPTDDQAWGRLSELIGDVGRLSDALNLATTAIQLRPGDPAHHARLALHHLEQWQAHFDLGDQQQAESSLHRATLAASNAYQLGPVDVGGIVSSATNRLQHGHLQSAMARFQIALLLQPDCADAKVGLGVVLKSLGDLSGAVNCYQQAIQLAPDDVVPHINLGNALRELGHLEDSLRWLEKASEIGTDSAEAFNNQGLTLEMLGRSEEAERSYIRSLRLQSASAECLNNLALLYNNQSEFALADRFFQQAIEDKPEHAAIRNNYAKCLKDQEKLSEAAEQYGRVAELIPGQPLLRLRQACLWPNVFRSREELVQCQSQFKQAVEAIHVERTVSLNELVNLAEKPPFGLQFSHENIRNIKHRYAQLIAGAIEPQQPIRPRTGKPRVGIVVTRNHEGIFLRSLKSVLTRLPMDDYEIVVVADQKGAGRIETELASERIVVSSMPHQLTDLQGQLNHMQFDVLYYWEVGTDMLNYFLPFYRLAPTQFTSWGVQVTTGIPTIDFYVSSSQVEPDEAGLHYSEQLLLGDSLWSYQVPLDQPATNAMKVEGDIDPDAHLYVVAQHPGKLHPDFDEWMGGILQADERAQILVTINPDSPSGVIYRDRLRSRLPGVSDRIRLLSRLPKAEYHQLIQRADVLLDPPHFGGVNSTYDALAFGKIVVTRPGEFHRGRYTAACLRRIGREDCIAQTAEEYVEIAVRFGRDAELRKHVERAILDAHDQLFRDETAVAEHEQLFQQLIAESRAS